MQKKFDYFVIFAEMRTGSNFLESNLDLFPGLKTYGEAFNPYFMVRPKMKELFGVTVEQRNENPIRLLQSMVEHSAGMPGFRFFSDHDNRVFEYIIEDPRCAKVVLSRNHVDAYVSRKIAWETDQWQLNDLRDVRKKKARFVPSEFEKLFNRFKDFQLKIMHRLQKSGQTAFYIDYEDAQDLEVINGLARFLGEDTQIEEFAGKFKKQNPEALKDKVVNFADLEATVEKIDLFDVNRIPNFEPRRTAAVPTYLSAKNVPAMYLPVQGALDQELRGWLADLDGTDPEDLQVGMTQKDLRKWKRQHRGARSFTLVRHPVRRAYSTFCHHFFTDGAELFPEIRHALKEHYDVPFPDLPLPEDYSADDHRATFLAFMQFVKRNLDGQTTIRVDPSWASQSHIVQGFAQVLPPDLILREERLAEGLAFLADELGIDAPKAPIAIEDTPFSLDDIYNADVEDAVRAVYQRDYMLFGYAKLKR